MLRLILRTLIILSFVVGIYSCSRPPQELRTAESLIETAPDSALHILQRLPPDKYKSGESRALYGLLLIQTLDKEQLSLKPESLLDYSISYYMQNPEPDRLATCYLYKGRTYKYAFQYEKAIECYLKALEEIKKSMNYLLLGRINSDIADIYLYQQEYEPATQKYLLAYKYFKDGNFLNFAHYSLIKIGKSYSQTKQFQKAHEYLQKVYFESRDSLVQGFALQDLGINYYYSKQYDSALFFLRKSIKYPYIKTNQALRLYYLADLYYDLKEIDSANYYALNAFKYDIDIRTQRECYRILANVEGLKKKFR